MQMNKTRMNRTQVHFYHLNHPDNNDNYDHDDNEDDHDHERDPDILLKK